MLTSAARARSGKALFRTLGDNGECTVFRLQMECVVSNVPFLDFILCYKFSLHVLSAYSWFSL